MHFQNFIRKKWKKKSHLQSINKKIPSLTDAADMPEEMVEAEELTLDLEVKLRKYKKLLH